MGLVLRLTRETYVYIRYRFDSTGGNVYNPERRIAGTGRTEAKGGQHATIGCFSLNCIDFYYCYFPETLGEARKRRGNGRWNGRTEAKGRQHTRRKRAVKKQFSGSGRKTTTDDDDDSGCEKFKSKKISGVQSRSSDFLREIWTPGKI